VSPDKIVYVKVPGVLGWREYKLRELVWLWRTAQLPHNAVFQNAQDEWRRIDELVDPIIERENRAAAANGMENRPFARRRTRWVWFGSSVVAPEKPA